MAIIAMPTSLLVGTLTQRIHRFDEHEMSGETGDSADRLLGVPRWGMSIGSPNKINAAAMDDWRDLLVRLRGRVNFLSAWDVKRAAPRGTCRGTMTLSGTHAKGATSLTIAVTGQNGLTLVSGDWLQLGSGLTGQLVMVVGGTYTANTSQIVVTVEHPLRWQFSGGAAVTWDKALGHYKLLTESIQFCTVEGGMLESGAGGDFMEQW